MNPGKVFENQFKNSVPDYVFYHRLPDPVESFNDIKNNLKFTLQNPCDVFLYNPRTKDMFAFELKSTKDTSLTYWTEEFEKANPNAKFMIRKNQIEGLAKIAGHEIVSGFIYNFRFTNHTYFQSIQNFNEMISGLEKKSFNEADVLKNGGILIAQELMRKNYKFDIEKLLYELVEDQNEK